GVTLTHGAAVLRGVRKEYLVEPDEQAMAEAAHRRLGWVAQARAIAWPESSPQTVEDVLELAVAASIPEAVAVGEGVEAALASLDAFTRPVWPREIASWERHHAGVMVGVGLGVLDAPDGTVIVDVPWLGSPAWEADVRQRDQVMAVDDVSVADLDPPRAASVQRLLAGEPGSTVEVTLARPGASAAHAVHIERGPWPEQTVTGFARHTDNTWSPWLDEDAGIAFVRISAFRPSTHHDFDALLADLTPRALILDLRGNPGGDVNAAAHVTDRFVADGIVADLVGRAIEPPELADGEVSWNTALPGNHLEAVGELVVLIDEDTASAAELVAGALRERRGAILVGAESVGKGLSQGLRTDEGAGVAWQVTTGTWTLPSGTPLETPQGPSGLVPDRTVALSAAEGFQVSVLRRQREQLVTHRDGTPVAYLGEVGRPELPTLPADPQIATAVMLLTEP
ncbi:MAG: PDZ domain-containing protein, partial [Myxococcales bacterium]|nr:PDZ domain-containing protein [Myxococcales bacterium]